MATTNKRVPKLTRFSGGIRVVQRIIALRTMSWCCEAKTTLTDGPPRRARNGIPDKFGTGYETAGALEIGAQEFAPART
jgi:hypothetical protein